MVIALAVTIATKGALGGLLKGVLGKTLGGIATAAVAAAAGSAVSQGVGVATGIQDKFSFKDVGLAAVSAGVAAGLPAIPGFEKIGGAINATFKNAAVRRVVNEAVNRSLVNAASQGVSIAVGLQSKFSFASVAAAAVSGAVEARFGDFGVAKYLNGKVPAKLAGYASNLTANTASGLAGAAARTLITGTSFGDNVRAVTGGLLLDHSLFWALSCMALEVARISGRSSERDQFMKVGFNVG